MEIKLLPDTVSDSDSASHHLKDRIYQLTHMVQHKRAVRSILIPLHVEVENGLSLVHAIGTQC